MLPDLALNSTVPSTIAKIGVVFSHTYTSARMELGAPRCLMIILPGTTLCPPYIFTPSLLPAESRPFLNYHPPFSLPFSKPINLCVNFFNTKHSDLLLMPTFASVIMTAFLFKNNNFISPALLKYFRRNFGA